MERTRALAASGIPTPERQQARARDLLLATVVLLLTATSIASATPPPTEKPFEPASVPETVLPSPSPPQVPGWEAVEGKNHWLLAPDGLRYEKIHGLAHGVETVVYRRGGQEWTQREFEAHLAATPIDSVDPALRRLANSLSPGDLIEVVLWLENQPGGNIVRDERARRADQVQELRRQAVSIHRRARPTQSLDPDQERDFIAQAQAGMAGYLTATEEAQLLAISEQIEELDAEAKRSALARTRDAIAADQVAVAELVADLGGEIVGRTILQSSLTASIPAGVLDQLAAETRIAALFTIPEMQLELNNQGSSLGLTTGFWNASIDGGIWDAGVLDTGVQQNHPNLDHLSFLSTFGTTDSDGHGTGIAGIIASDHATYRGMSYGMDAMLVGSCGSTSVMPHADWMVSTAGQDPEAINLSCGYGRANDTDYSVFDQFFDGLIDDNSVFVGKSAGNGGFGVTTITHPAPSYNLMAVANVYDQNTVDRADDVIWSTSSRGPTLSGRKKPDIAAPGNNTFSTENTWATGPDFGNIGGTSAAAPHVTGGAVLLTDLRSSDTPYANKSVLINTADAWTDGGGTSTTSDDGQVDGSEWNATYGWGYLDLWESWFNGNDVFVHTVDDGVTPANERDFRLYEGYMFADEKASLVWNRHVTYNGSGNPTAVESLTDLDLLMYDADDGSSLGSAHDGANNVEQIATSSGGNRVLKVDVFGTIDPDVGIESYALATEENFTEVQGPSYAFSISGGASPGRRFWTTATITNNGDTVSTNNTATIGLPPGYSLLAGANPQALGTIAEGGSAEASWQLQAPCNQDLVAINYDAENTTFGEIFAGGIFGLTIPSVTALNYDTAVVGNQIERTYSFDVATFDWIAVGINGRGVDRDVWGDNDLCVTSPYQTSTIGGATRDFIIVDGRDHGTSTHYALATWGLPGNFDIEAEDAYDFFLGQQVDDSFTNNEVIDVFEVSASAGEEVFVRVDVTSGSTDVGLFVYQSSLTDGDRASASFSSASTNPGGSEYIYFVADTTSNFGIVVVNDNATAGTYRIRADRGFFSDGFESGDTTAWSSTLP